MNFLQKIIAINNVLKLILGAICALLMLSLTLSVLWGVLTRYIFGAQPPFTEEFARMFLVSLTFLGGALCFGRNSHIGLDYLVSKFTMFGKKVCAIFSVSASIFFAIAILIIGGSIFTMRIYDAQTMLDSAPIYYWQIYICIPIAGIFSLMFLLESLARILTYNTQTAEETK